MRDHVVAASFIQSDDADDRVKSRGRIEYSRLTGQLWYINGHSRESEGALATEGQAPTQPTVAEGDKKRMLGVNSWWLVGIT